jgi:uncharacterized protein (DUF1015 family)
VLSSEEAKVLAADNPYSFLYVDKAEICFPSDVSPYDPAVYKKANENLRKLINDGVLIQDDKPCLYIYRLSVGNKSQTGLVACLHADDYNHGLIKKHELTRPDKENDRAAHIRGCSAHASPVFMAYRDNGNPRKTMNDFIQNNPNPLYLHSRRPPQERCRRPCG